MSGARKIFGGFSPEDKRYLELMCQGIRSNNPNDTKKVRESLARMNEQAILHFFSQPSIENIDEAIKKQLQALINFCHQDAGLQLQWKERLKKKSYISEDLVSQSGSVIRLFDLYLGSLSYLAILDNKLDRTDRAVAAVMAEKHKHYYGLLYKCQKILINISTDFKKNITQKASLLVLLNSLGDHFWSLGHMQAASLLHQFKDIAKHNQPSEDKDDTNLKEINDLISKECLKAESLIETEQSLVIFSAIKANQTLEDFLQKKFGVDSVAKIKDILINNVGSESFSILTKQAEAESIELLEKTSDLFDSDDDEIDEDSEINAIAAQLKKLAAQSSAISTAIKQTMLPPPQNKAVNKDTQPNQNPIEAKAHHPSKN